MFQIVGDVRGKGLMIGIELVDECTNLSEVFLNHGLVVNITKEKIIRMLPPLIINKNHVDDIIDIIEKVLD